MENAVQTISLFNSLFYVSLGVAILGLVLAVVIFFLFDIPSVFALRTGKHQKQAVEQMNERSAQGGGFSTRRDPKKGTTEQIRRQNMASLRMENHTGEITDPSQKPVIQPPQKPAAPVAAETEVLGAGETQVLGAGETEILGAGETTALNQPTAPVVIQSFQPMQSGMTQELTGAKPQPRANYNFMLVREEIYCDSQERI